MVNPPNFHVLLFDEAAQNAAALAGIAAIAETSPIFSNSGDKLKALRDGWIFGLYVFGDSLDITQAQMSGLSSMQGRTFDMRGSGIETGHDVPNGFIDLRFNPFSWPANEELQFDFKEDKSTNVEASVLVWWTPDPYGLSWARQVKLYKELMALTLTGASSTAAVWFDSTKTLDDNHDTRVLDPEATYEIIGMAPGLGGSSIKAARLIFPSEGNVRPGGKVAEDNVDFPIPPWESSWPEPRPQFLGTNPPRMETFDRDGSLTPIVTFLVGRI